MEDIKKRIEMTLDEYLDTLIERDYALFSGNNYAVWVHIICDLLPILGNETEPLLEHCVQVLLHYYDTGEGGEQVKQIRINIVRGRGVRFYLDGSCLGLKYRCLNNIASTVEENEADIVNCAYGITLALDAISDFCQDEQEVIAFISKQLEAMKVV